MILVDLAQKHVRLRPGGNKHYGPCPKCGGDDAASTRFVVYQDDTFHCFGCGWHGGPVKFLMQLDGLKCHEAHAALGLSCDLAACQVSASCPAGKQGAVAGPRRLRTPKPEAARPFVPETAAPPEEIWRQRADKLINEAHSALLACPEQLAYLDSRGLALAAVERYRLGWIAEALYRPRAAWGLPEKLNTTTGKPKKLWIPRGILIPTLLGEVPHRLRIRRPNEDLKEGDGKYIEVEGSGTEKVILNPQARAVVVVESDLDALLIDWLAGDLVGALPTVSASGKPRSSIWPLLISALRILVASDFDSHWDDERGRWVSAGGSAATWWTKTFPRARRWPVPDGKDPGEFAQGGGDIRAWVLAGLPPVFHLPAPAVPVAALAEAAAAVNAEDAHNEIQQDTGEPSPGYILGVSQGGISYLVVDRADDLPELQALYPDHAAFCRAEMRHLQGLPPETVHETLLLRRQFAGSTIMTTLPLVDAAEQARG